MSNVIVGKSYAFALRVIRMYQFLVREKKEFVLAKQILRCGTSIGANIEEAQGGQTRKDFITKMTIAYKEARYWLRLLKDSEILDAKSADSMLLDCDEILRLLASILKTTKDKNS